MITTCPWARGFGTRSASSGVSGAESQLSTTTTHGRSAVRSRSRAAAANAWSSTVSGFSPPGRGGSPPSSCSLRSAWASDRRSSLASVALRNQPQPLSAALCQLVGEHALAIAGWRLDHQRHRRARCDKALKLAQRARARREVAEAGETGQIAVDGQHRLRWLIGSDPGCIQPGDDTADVHQYPSAAAGSSLSAILSPEASPNSRSQSRVTPTTLTGSQPSVCARPTSAWLTPSS